MTSAQSAAAATSCEAPKTGDKFAPYTVGPCSLEDLRRYAQASGDDNPIHLDPELARRAGLAAPPVHGMLLMSRFEPALAVWRPDLALTRLSCKFLRPIFAGETVELSGRIVQVTAGEPMKILLRLMMHNQQRELALVGEAMAIRRSVA